MDADQTPYLHVYGQAQWHDMVHIVGNLPALKLLYKTLHMLVTVGEREQDNPKWAVRGCEEMFVTDGEGFTGEVSLVPNAHIMQLPEPYTDEIARDRREDRIWPWADEEDEDE